MLSTTLLVLLCTPLSCGRLRGAVQHPYFNSVSQYQFRRHMPDFRVHGHIFSIHCQWSAFPLLINSPRVLHVLEYSSAARSSVQRPSQSDDCPRTSSWLAAGFFPANGDYVIYKRAYTDEICGNIAKFSLADFSRFRIQYGFAFSAS